MNIKSIGEGYFGVGDGYLDAPIGGGSGNVSEGGSAA